MTGWEEDLGEEEHNCQLIKQQETRKIDVFDNHGFVRERKKTKQKSSSVKKLRS